MPRVAEVKLEEPVFSGEQVRVTAHVDVDFEPDEIGAEHRIVVELWPKELSGADLAAVLDPGPVYTFRWAPSPLDSRLATPYTTMVASAPTVSRTLINTLPRRLLDAVGGGEVYARVRLSREWAAESGPVRFVA